MSKLVKSTSDTVAEFFGAFVVYPLLAGWALQYVLDFWVSVARHTHTHVALLACAVACLIPRIGQLAIASWILTLLFGYLARS